MVLRPFFRRSLSASVVTLSIVACARTIGGQSTSGAELTVDRLGLYVERYYARAQTIVADESVTVQRLARDMSPDGFARRLVYELRVEWDPSATGDDSPATVTRQLISVNGRMPRPGDEPECMDPRSVSPEPLAFLLPDRRHRFTFRAAGLGRVEGREALMVDYQPLEIGKPKVEWTDECVSVDVPGKWRGRVWANPADAAVLRLDEQLTGMVDVPVPRKHQRFNSSMYITLERADMSIRYRPVAFSDPDETLMLPSEIVSSAMWRNAGSPGSRIRQTFSNYRRFVTGSRIVQ